MSLYSDIGKYTCTFEESDEKTISASRTITYSRSDPGAILPQMFLEREGKFVSAKRFWAAAGVSDTESIISSADTLCAITGEKIIFRTISRTGLLR